MISIAIKCVFPKKVNPCLLYETVVSNRGSMSVSCCYALVHNIKTRSIQDVSVTQSAEGIFSQPFTIDLQGERRLAPLSNPQTDQNPGTVEKRDQEILYAFEKSENDNEQRLSKIMGTMINQTVESILEAERESDKKFKEIFSSLPYYRESSRYIKPIYYSHQLSVDLISQLK